MVQIKEKTINEFRNKKGIFISCKECNIIIGEYYKFENESRKFWYTKFSQIDWYVRSEIRCENNELFCDCDNLLGILLNNGDVYLLKQNTKVDY